LLKEFRLIVLETIHTAYGNLVLKLIEATGLTLKTYASIAVPLDPVQVPRQRLMVPSFPLVASLG
jgi:hypothetical protein